MSNNNVLYRIRPIKESYIPSGIHYNDEICEYVRHSENFYYYEMDPIFFNTQDEILKWMRKNVGGIIPIITRIEYIGDFNEVKDIFKISDLDEKKYKYITAISEDKVIYYDEKNNQWLYMENIFDAIKQLDMKSIYEAFIKRGIKLSNVFKTKENRENEFVIIDERGKYQKHQSISQAYAIAFGNEISGRPSNINAVKEEVSKFNEETETLKQMKLERKKPMIYIPDNTRRW